MNARTNDSGTGSAEVCEQLGEGVRAVKAAWAADEHQTRDASWVVQRHLLGDVPAARGADEDGGLHLERVEERQHVCGSVAETVPVRGRVRCSVPAQVRSDDAQLRGQQRHEPAEHAGGLSHGVQQQDREALRVPLLEVRQGDAGGQLDPPGSRHGSMVLAAAVRRNCRTRAGCWCRR